MAGSADPRWHVHFGRLSAAADGAAEIARGLRQTTDATEAGCVSAASAHPAWSCAASLEGLHKRFSAHVEAHAGHIDGIGDRLTESHRTYHQVESSNYEDVRATGVPVPQAQEI